MDDLREKVIKGLECLAGMNELKSNPCMDCGYRECQTYAICVREIAIDALSLLKAQEARVMTLEEIQNLDAAVFMDEDGNPMCIKMLYSYEIGSGKTIYHGYTFVDSAGDKIFFPARDFNKKWRCWASRPTDEQRKAVKWE